jgi:membrane associated rhomboid family serine protease
MRIRYNAPVTLTFAFLSSVILLVDSVFGGRLTQLFFSVPGAGAFDWANPLNYIRLVGHVAGHANWTHLMSNFAIILLLGPILEEKYRSGGLLGMVLVTALVTGLLNALLLPQGLLGASGIVFMMILLSSFSNIRSGEIPLTFILIVVLYLTREIVQSFQENTISEFAHIAGGICGSLFGFLQPRQELETPPQEGA